MEKVALGQVNSITAHQGVYLQVRPKAMNSNAKTQGIDADGLLMKTLPRGFYLRTCFTAEILKWGYLR
jgi:DNA mismatch repair protein MutH